MKKSTIFSLSALCALFAFGNADAQTYMLPATLDYPSSLFSSMPPSSVDITWNNQPIELVDPTYNEYDEEVTTTFVKLGDAEQVPVSAGILSSFGNPEDPNDPDIWALSIALYELDELWDFTGDKITVIIPEGIVKNIAGAVNPAQEFVFQLMPTFTSYSETPTTGSMLTEENLKVRISFENNQIEYLSSVVSARTYEPEYKDISLEYGKEVTIENNELIIDLGSLESGNYELVVPEAFLLVTVDGEKYLSPDIWYEYDIDNPNSGVSNIAVSKASNTIFTLDGKALNNRSLLDLPKGFYIINGKKIVK